MADLCTVAHSLTPDRWGDFEELFGSRGACGGCWCMAWRLPRAEWERGKASSALVTGEANRAAMKRIVDDGGEPGILLYTGGHPVAWCSVAQRQEFVYLSRTRTLKPLDNQPVWSVTCFFIRRDHRGRGLSAALLKAAAGFVRARGGSILEGYPLVRTSGLPSPFVWTGITSAFLRAGFHEHPSGSTARRIMRLQLE